MGDQTTGPKRGEDADRKYGRGENRKARNIEVGGWRHRTRRKQREGHKCLQPCHGRKRTEECWPPLQVVGYHTPALNGQEAKWLAEYLFMRSMLQAGVRRKACVSRYGGLNRRAPGSPKAGSAQTASSIIQSRTVSESKPVNMRCSFTLA